MRAVFPASLILAQCELPWKGTGFGGVSVRPHVHTSKSGDLPYELRFPTWQE
jgi:hypothetical protein